NTCSRAATAEHARRLTGPALRRTLLCEWGSDPCRGGVLEEHGLVGADAKEIDVRKTGLEWILLGWSISTFRVILVRKAAHVARPQFPRLTIRNGRLNVNGEWGHI